MDLKGEKPLYYATDLTNFVACRHLSVLERLAASGLAKRPFFDDPMLDVLRDRGLAHEQEYVRTLRRRGKRVVEVSRAGSALEETTSAMRDGADVIVQGRLEHGSWAGWVDVLLRVDGTSEFGSWKYEPVETKLAKTTRAATLIQLCVYADLLAKIQGVEPDVLRVVVPERKFEPEEYRFAEFAAYYRLVRRNFEAQLELPIPESTDAAEPYPDPVTHCADCNWYGHCDKRWRNDDSLTLVARITKGQRKELASWDVTTLTALAELPLPLERTPSHGSVAALEAVREQARLQHKARTENKPVFEPLPLEPGKGLLALPAATTEDLFLDFEGDPLAEDGGLDYLFGYASGQADGETKYNALWALSPSEEKRAFETVIDLIVERRAREPKMHVFHYAPYEVTSLKRLMGRYGTRADELDDLLRGEVFVDLYGIVRSAIRAGVESYSIKTLEPFYGLERSIDPQKVTRHLRAVEYAIARNEAGALTGEVRESVRSYNEDDCRSALELRNWLERLRLEAEERNGAPLPRPAPPSVEEREHLNERLARVRAVSDALTKDLPIERTREQEATWILAQLLEWQRREDKVSWWEYFRLNEMSDTELLDERAGISKLAFDGRIETTPRGVVVDRYSFPAQDTEFEDHDEALAPRSEKPTKAGTIEEINLETRKLVLRKPKAGAEQHPVSLFKSDRVGNREAEDALLRLGEFVRDNGMDAPGAHRAARDLLLRHNPRLRAGEPLRRPDESPGESARRAVLALDGGLLAIQGPPGAGKTFLGAQMIVDLVRARKRIGVTAVSHKVIRNLLDEVVRAAGLANVTVRCMHRVREKSKIAPVGIVEEKDAAKAVAKIQGGEYDVVGGTAWVWPRHELTEMIDVLFVDEAGQMSLANVLACAQAAKNVVLLGDPQQLEQPQQASHPIGTELSALEHLLEGHDTMPDERGLFLAETWRLHPNLCAFTSELFYEGKLRPRPGLERQAIDGATPFRGAGLFYVPVNHTGNENRSSEEAVRIAEIVESMLASGATWTDREGKTHQLRLENVLIVAPYNAQVSEIAGRIPGGRVGTVDRFQGQEAPIVIYSTTTSNPEDAPHGMEFLFNRHRLNVATSRARCVCILVGNPALFEPNCRTPEQTRMANAFCRYLELARTPERVLTEV